MKRSAQVALVLMGVTGTTATAAYMMPARPECRPQPAASTALNPPAAVPQQGAVEQPCRRRAYRSWGNWGWNSRSYYPSTSTSTRQGLFSTGRTSLSTAPTSSGTGSRSVSAPSTSRGGFGSTGHSMSGGGRGGGSGS